MLTSLRGCGLHMITMCNVLTDPLINRMDEPVDTGFAIRRFVKENANIELKSLPLPKNVNDLDNSELEMMHRNETARSREQSSNLDRSSCPETQHAIYSESGPLSRFLVKVYQELTENKILLKQIQESIKSNYTKDETEIIDAPAQSLTLDDEPNSKLESGSARALTWYRSDTSSDCISRFSEDEFCSTYDEWSAFDNPSPVGYMELSSSFYPERFMIDGLFKDPFFIISQKRSKVYSWTQEYFILYAETPRRW